MVFGRQLKRNVRQMAEDMTKPALPIIGAALYTVWGALHLFAASSVYQLAASFDPGMVQGRLYQSAWNLLFFAVFAIVVAVFFNRNNTRTGYWLNLVVVSVTDIGFIAFVLMPGYLPVWPGVLGPIFWVASAVVTTLARRQESHEVSH